MKHVEETCRRDSPGPLARGPGSARTPRRSHLGGVTHPVSRCGCLRPPRSDWRHPRGARWRKLGGLPTQGHSPSWRQQQCLSKICTQQFSVLARWVHFCSRPLGGVAHKAMAAVPGVRTAWEERAPRHLRQGPRLGGKLGLSMGGTPAPDLTAPPVANAPDFPGRRGSVPGLPSPGTVSMDVAV